MEEHFQPTNLTFEQLQESYSGMKWTKWGVSRKGNCFMHGEGPTHSSSPLSAETGYSESTWVDAIVSPEGRVLNYTFNWDEWSW